MKTLPLVILAAFCLSGCEQYRQSQWQHAFNQKRATALRNGWTPARETIQKPPPQVRSGGPMMAGGPPIIMPPPIIVESAPMAPQRPSAPQSVIFTGGGNGTTIAQQVGDTTLVSQIGGWDSGTTIAQQVGGSTIVSQFGGRNSGTTIAQQVGDTTVVSQFGGWQPPIGGYRPIRGYAPRCGQPVGFVPSW